MTEPPRETVMPCPCCHRAVVLRADGSFDDLVRCACTTVSLEWLKLAMEAARIPAEPSEVADALEELLSGHDNLYVALFGPYSDPRDDIAAKPARSLLAAMRPNERGE